MIKIELAHPQEWARLFDILAQFDADIQSEELMVTVKPYADVDINEQACVLNKFRDEICPEIIEEAHSIAEFLKNNSQETIHDPVESMSLAWDTFAKDAVPQFDEEIKYNNKLATAVSNFWNSIGEAMGPVCFAAFELRDTLDKAVLPKDWVDECVKYYMNNWRF